MSPSKCVTHMKNFKKLFDSLSKYWYLLYLTAKCCTYQNRSGFILYDAQKFTLLWHEKHHVSIFLGTFGKGGKNLVNNHGFVFPCCFCLSNSLMWLCKIYGGKLLFLLRLMRYWKEMDIIFLAPADIQGEFLWYNIPELAKN